jgi:RimJ/RimL family protein N-acetyltransferase
MTAMSGAVLTTVPSGISLLDGRRVTIRPVAPTDRAPIAEFFANLSPASLHWRFFVPRRRLNARLLDQLLATGPGRAAYLAMPADCTGPVVAFGGWIHVPDAGSCEISVAVADAWQGVRLGTLLVLALLQDARARGQRRFHAEVMGGNIRMLGLLRELAAPFRTRIEAGVVRVEFELSA